DLPIRIKRSLQVGKRTLPGSHRRLQGSHARLCGLKLRSAEDPFLKSLPSTIDLSLKRFDLGVLCFSMVERAPQLGPTRIKRSLQVGKRSLPGPHGGVQGSQARLRTLKLCRHLRGSSECLGLTANLSLARFERSGQFAGCLFRSRLQRLLLTKKDGGGSGMRFQRDLKPAVFRKLDCRKIDLGITVGRDEEQISSFFIP